MKKFIAIAAIPLVIAGIAGGLVLTGNNPLHHKHVSDCVAIHKDLDALGTYSQNGGTLVASGLVPLVDKIRKDGHEHSEQATALADAIGQASFQAQQVLANPFGGSDDLDAANVTLEQAKVNLFAVCPA